MPLTPSSPASPASRFAALVAALCALTVSMLGFAPEPDPVPTRWEFEFRPDHLKVALVESEDVGPQLYYYMTYRVANYTGRDRLFAPSFELVTNEGDVLRSGRGVPPEVTDNLIDRSGNPFLQNQIQIVAPLLQGFENARFGIAIWPVIDLDLDEVRVFAAGMSGENKPFFTVDPETGERVRHVLRKTRMLRYRTPGIIEPTGADTLPLAEERWIMR